MLKAKSAEQVLENVVVECVHCGVPMTGHLGSGKRVRYFRCSSCRRWVTSTYAEILGADAKVKAKTESNPGPSATAFDAVKSRLERWLTLIDRQDPYQILGVSPRDSDETIRNRYRELAFKLHPDRGGSGERMQTVNNAFERITRHRETEAVKMMDLSETALSARGR